MSDLSAAQRAALGALPVPSEGGSPVAACVTGGSGAWRTAWAIDGGRRKEAFGPVYRHVSQAIAAVRFLNERTFGPAA